MSVVVSVHVLHTATLACELNLIIIIFNLHSSALSSSGDTFSAIKQTIQAQANCGTQVMIMEMTKDLCTPKSLPS